MRQELNERSFRGLPKVVVELCVDDVDGALVADREGADRIELCANLAEGGTTPSIGMILSVVGSVRRVGLQIIIRPRGGDFVYSESEIDVMCRDLEAIGAVATESFTPVGVVLGALTSESEIDVPTMRRLLDAAGTLPVTFHKAFDMTRDKFEAYETLRQLGVERVLTSGGPHSALEGSDILTDLVRRSFTDADAPSILVGGSVRPTNIREIVDVTRATEVHLRAQSLSERSDGTLMTDVAVVRELFKALETRNLTGVETEPPVQSMAVIAIDVGGTNFKGALVDASGKVLTSRSVGVGNTGDESVALILDLAHDLRSRAEKEGYRLVGTGIVTPGMVDSEEGVIHYASSLDWTDVRLKDIVKAELGVPVHIGHDVRSSGLAEDLFGASHGSGDSVLVAIGTGVAASIMSGGHRVVGAISTAGELGHIPVIPDGEICTCGQRGCLEAYFSGAGLARRYAALGGDRDLDAAAIVARLSVDRVADRVWSEGVHALALGLASLTLLIDPAVIVLTGGVSRAGDLLLEPLRIELAALLEWRHAPELRISELGTAGSRIGAAILAFQTSGHSEIVNSWSAEDVLCEALSLSTF